MKERAMEVLWTLLEDSLRFVGRYRRRVTGAAIGLVIALLFLNVGFWGTLLIGVCVGAGLLAAAPKDRHAALLARIEKLLPGGKNDD